MQPNTRLVSRHLAIHVLKVKERIRDNAIETRHRWPSDVGCQNAALVRVLEGASITPSWYLEGPISDLNPL
jgi:hypothetical protein